MTCSLVLILQNCARHSSCGLKIWKVEGQKTQQVLGDGQKAFLDKCSCSESTKLLCLFSFLIFLFLLQCSRLNSKPEPRSSFFNLHLFPCLTWLIGLCVPQWCTLRTNWLNSGSPFCLSISEGNNYVCSLLLCCVMLALAITRLTFLTQPAPGLVAAQLSRCHTLLGSSWNASIKAGSGQESRCWRKTMNQPLLGDKNVGLFGLGKGDRELRWKKRSRGRRCLQGLIGCRKLRSLGQLRGISKCRGQVKNVLTFLEGWQFIFWNRNNILRQHSV